MTVTLTFGTAAPDESVTVPVMVPVLICPYDGSATLLSISSAVARICPIRKCRSWSCIAHSFTKLWCRSFYPLAVSGTRETHGRSVEARAGRLRPPAGTDFLAVISRVEGRGRRWRRIFRGTRVHYFVPG